MWVQVIPSAPNPHKKPVYLKIIGAKPMVAKVKQAIKTLMRTYHVDWVHPGITHVELDIPTACVLPPRAPCAPPARCGAD